MANNNTNRKRIWIITLGVVVVLALVYGFWPKPTLVEMAEVTRGPMEVVLEEEGLTRVVDRYVVEAPVTGYARRLDLDVGDAIVQGDPLAYLEPLRPDVLDPRRRAEAQARVAAAQAALRSAEEQARAAAADAALATAEAERVEALHAGGAATDHQRDQAQATLRHAEAMKTSADFGVEVGQHEVEAAQTALRYTASGSGQGRLSINAPVHGRVLAIHHRSEGVVQAGTPLVEVGDPRALEVAVDVLSSDAIQLEAGMPVRFTRWGGDRPLEGIVRVVEPVGFTKVSALGVEEQRVWVVVDFTSSPEMWQRLGDGYRVVAQFITWAHDDALQVPASALFRDGDGWAAFVVRDGTAHFQPVSVAHRSGLTAHITDGLAEGDTVVIHPPAEVADGVAVETRG